MEPPWLTIARGMIGTIEGPGPSNNPRVVDFYEEAGHAEIKSDAVPWCAAFVGACLKRAGVKGSGSLAARSYEAWGQPLKKPILGCVAVKKRGGSGWQGHVGFVVGASPTKTIILLGGNQGDKVSVASFKRSEFTAFRWPANIGIPTPPLPLPANVAAAQKNPTES